ncbi:hypothetical protein GCM10019016_128550 [Streptomyces prasinosporus]|uniref:[2Fe-2S]-binding domain-containing protein n=1 Tax=Streptomyces prasinosporus TaxID=68256 RepID=A0ABP6UDR4_9ACTN
MPVCSCLVAAGQAEGREVVTVEGLADLARQRSRGAGARGTPLDEARRWQAGGTRAQTGEGDGLSPVQQAFIDAGAVQCGFCTPGLLVAADEMLEHNPDPTDEDIREALSGNLCRCTGYEKIMDAVRLAAARRSEGG